MSAVTTVAPVVLEPAAQEFAVATAAPPFLYDLGPVEGRKTVDQVQSGEVAKPDVEIKWAEAARDYERRLLGAFAEQHGGRRPFANLAG